MRYKVTLSYDGTSLSGWQIQPNARTVQECLEKSLSTLLRTEVSVTGAGRTDSGVSAVGYTAHFDLPAAYASAMHDTTAFSYKLNAILPPCIVIHGIVPAEGEDFHARFSAREREYTYFLHSCKDPFIEKFSFFCPYRLDFDAMNRAAALLGGTHDFISFEKKGSDAKTSICTVNEAFWTPYVPSHVSVLGYEAPAGAQMGYWYFRISADRFLRNMVRAVVGSLLEVGRGKRDEEWFASLLESGHERSDAGESVPGNALFLSKVRYL